jgi:hypothetical protein
MRTYPLSTLAATIVLTAVAGCASIEPLQSVDCATAQYRGFTARELFPVTPRFDCAFGDSVSMAIARQTLDPDAAARNANKGAVGMDGIAARDALYNYQKSFRSPEPASNAFTISVGGAAPGGAR